MARLAILTLHTSDATFSHLLVVAHMDIRKPPILLKQYPDGEKNDTNCNNYYRK